MFHYAVVLFMIALVTSLLGTRRESLRRRKVHQFSRVRKPRSSLNVTLLMGCALGLCWQATPRSAWAFPSNEEMRDVGSAPVGIPVQEFFDKSLSMLAREMLLQQHLDAEVHRNQSVHGGIEMDLFAPGDVGVVVRYCW